MAFRNRGIKVVVDTTDTAEFDISGLQLTESFLANIEKSFTEVPFSDSDQCQGNLRGRTLNGYDFFFIVGQVDAELVVTIGGVSPHVDEGTLGKALKIADKVGIFRGVTGI